MRLRAEPESEHDESPALPDARLEALHRFATLVVRERAFVPEPASYGHRKVLDVALGVATEAMSNYTNDLVDTQPDKFMTGNEWTKPAGAQRLKVLTVSANR